MPLANTLAEKFPNLDLTHRDTLHRLADSLGQQGHVPSETAVASKKLGTMKRKKKTWDQTGRYPHTKRVGPYLLGKILGEGSFAKVKEAMHSVVGEKVAVKVVDKKSIKDDVYLRKNMRREAAILQTLHHPNIVRLYEVMETDNNLYMVLELCTGGPLLDKICSEGKLRESTTKGFVRQMLSAVDHMHQAGVLHRDLKVENLLLDGCGNLKLIDFGLSNFLGSISRNGRLRGDMQATQCGSPAYAAPEIIANKRYGPKVDVWSVGVNTFAMLTGTLPFVVEPFNIKVLLRRMVNKDMTQMPKYVSKDCHDFIKHLLQPDPRARPSVRDVMSHPWLTDARPPAAALPRPRTATPPPNGRISRVEVESDIVNHIWNTYGIQSSHVSNSVICKRADEYSAIYYLLIRKRDREDVKILESGQEAIEDRRVESSLKNSKDHSMSVDGDKNNRKDNTILAEMTALQLAGQNHGNLHGKVRTLALDEVCEEDNEGLETATSTEDSTEDQSKHAVCVTNVEMNTAPVTCHSTREGKDSASSEKGNHGVVEAPKTGVIQITARTGDQDQEVVEVPESGVIQILPGTGDLHHNPGESPRTHGTGSRHNITNPRNNTPTSSISKSSTKNEIQRCPTPATHINATVTDKATHFREAFVAAKTSSTAAHHVERRVSNIKAGPFFRQARKIPRHSVLRKDSEKMMNCAHKVNLTFRQSDPGCKDSFAEHFNYRRRNGTAASGDYTRGRSTVRVNLTPIYSPIKAPKQRHHAMHTSKSLDTNLENSITIKHQETFTTPREPKLSKLIEDVHAANAPPLPPEFDGLDDVACAVGLSKAQKDAMAMFRSTRCPIERKNSVPHEFKKLESTRRVKVAKRKSVVVDPADQTTSRLGSARPTRPSKTPHQSRPNRRRKLRMEETLERYRSRNPARSPCMCQGELEDRERASSENIAGMTKTKSSTLPVIAPPLVAISPRLRPLGGKGVQMPKLRVLCK